MTNLKNLGYMQSRDSALLISLETLIPIFSNAAHYANHGFSTASLQVLFQFTTSGSYFLLALSSVQILSESTFTELLPASNFCPSFLVRFQFVTFITAPYVK